jgi:hypothetical protein
LFPQVSREMKNYAYLAAKQKIIQVISDSPQT